MQAVSRELETFKVDYELDFYYLGPKEQDRYGLPDQTEMMKAKDIGDIYVQLYRHFGKGLYGVKHVERLDLDK